MRSNSSPPETLQQGTGKSGQEKRAAERRGDGQTGHSQLHDEVEVAPTLIDVIQGYDVGVLNPRRRNEVIQSLG